MPREKRKKLSRELTPEEVAEEAKDSDESLPEQATTPRRRLFSDRTAGGAEHRAGEEEKREEGPREEVPEPADPPERVQQPEGA